MVSMYICHLHDIPHIYIYIHDIVAHIAITYDYILIYIYRPNRYYDYVYDIYIYILILL